MKSNYKIFEFNFHCTKHNNFIIFCDQHFKLKIILHFQAHNFYSIEIDNRSVACSGHLPKIKPDDFLTNYFGEILNDISFYHNTIKDNRDSDKSYFNSEYYHNIEYFEKICNSKAMVLI